MILEIKDIKQELLNYFPNKDDIIDLFKEIGFTDNEIKQIHCKIPPELILSASERIINELSSLADDNILVKFAKVMNVTDNRFSFKTEFLFRSVYFLAKKKYGSYVIAQEGKVVPSFEMSGFGTKSDVPDKTNEMIRNLFKVIFITNGNVDLINRYLDKYRNIFKQMIKERRVEIGVPCGFNKQLSEYKTLPDNIRGMLLFNRLMNEEIFKPGNKGYKLYTKGIDFKKLGMTADEFVKLIEDFNKEFNIKKPKKRLTEIDRITIPVDYTRIPDWIILDEDTIMDKIFVSKANETLEALGITVTSEKREILDLF